MDSTPKQEDQDIWKNEKVILLDKGDYLLGK